MPYTNSTPNYGLPQYIATDKPTYLGDANSAYSTIDTRMKANATAVSANSNALSLLSARVLANEGNISTNTADISTLNTAIDGWVGSDITPAAPLATGSRTVMFRSNKKLGIMTFASYLTKGSVALTPGETIFILPEGHRPNTTMYYRGGIKCVGTNIEGFCTYEIAPSGIVSISTIITRPASGQDEVVRDLYIDVQICTAGWGTGFPPITQV